MRSDNALRSARRAEKRQAKHLARILSEEEKVAVLRERKLLRDATRMARKRASTRQAKPLAMVQVIRRKPVSDLARLAQHVATRPILAAMRPVKIGAGKYYAILARQPATGYADGRIIGTIGTNRAVRWPDLCELDGPRDIAGIDYFDRAIPGPSDGSQAKRTWPDRPRREAPTTIQDYHGWHQLDRAGWQRARDGGLSYAPRYHVAPYAEHVERAERRKRQGLADPIVWPESYEPRLG